MSYLIDGLLLFTPEDNLIENITDHSKQLLPRPAVLLLEGMVKNPSVTISRHSIMEDVWEPNGLTPSINNFNNYLSVIRSAFQKLGLNPDVLKTIPRVGIVLNCEIETKIPPNSAPALPTLKEANKSNKITLFFLLLLILILLHCIFLWVKKDSFAKLNSWTVNEHYGCTIYLFHSPTNNEYNIWKTKIKEVEKKYSLDCKNDFYAIYNVSNKYGDIKRKFDKDILTICRVDVRNRLPKDCYNYLSTEER